MTRLIEIIGCLDFLNELDCIDYHSTHDPYPIRNVIKESMKEILYSGNCFINILSIYETYCLNRERLHNYISSHQEDRYDYLAHFE